MEKKPSRRSFSFITLVGLSCSILLLAQSNRTFAGPEECGDVEVDCSTHKIKMNGIKEGSNSSGSNCYDDSVINCGAATVNGSGTVGDLHHGQVVPNGVDIKVPGMGQDGGGKVFHTPSPTNENSCPTGVDNTKGCVAVGKTVLNKLRQCKGAKLTIKGAKGGSGGGGGSSQGGSSGNGGNLN